MTRVHQQLMKPHCEEGASLVETMIAAALGVIITAAALDIFVMHHGHFRAQRAKSEAQQDIRGGMDLRDAHHAAMETASTRSSCLPVRAW